MANNVTAFDDFESITSRARIDSIQVLENKVSPAVKKILKRHIISDIYGAYKPKKNAWINGTTYKRRRKLDKKIDAFIEGDEGSDDDYTLLVTSTEDANESVVPGHSFTNRYAGSFLELLGSGRMGIWRKGFARPAVENAQIDVETDPAIDTAIESGIRKYMGEFDRI